MSPGAAAMSLSCCWRLSPPLSLPSLSSSSSSSSSSAAAGKRAAGVSCQAPEQLPPALSSRRKAIAAVAVSVVAAATARTCVFPAEALAAVATQEQYQEETFNLIEDIKKEFSLDPFDPARPALVADLKKRVSSYVARYRTKDIPVRKSSAKMYTALDALNGHFSFKGLAPVPKKLQDKVLGEFEDAITLINQGK